MTALFSDKVFLVTGASAGLGKSLAGAFAAAGARVAMAARGQSALEQAAAELRSRGYDCLPLVADVTDQSQAEGLIAQVVAHYGRLDGLVNNVGASARAAILDVTPDDLRQAIEINLLSTVHCTRAAMPHLTQQRGHVVNIGSLACKSASKYLGSYAAAKHALGAYTQQLRLELAPQGVHVLLVCPGPIQRAEVRTYGAEEKSNLPESARRPGGGVRTSALAPDRLAQRIVRACAQHRPELVVPGKARLLFAVQQLFPSLGDWLVNKMTRG